MGVIQELINLRGRIQYNPQLSEVTSIEWQMDIDEILAKVKECLPPPPKLMDLKEFCEKGYLQEANRQFFHPLGLAMAITLNEAGEYVFHGIIDSDDPTGIYFDNIDPGKAYNVAYRWWNIAELRRRKLGFIVQPSQNPDPF